MPCLETLREAINRVMDECDSARNRYEELKYEFDADMAVLPIRLRELMQDEHELDSCKSAIEFKTKQKTLQKEELRMAELELFSLTDEKASLCRDLNRIGQEFVENYSPFDNDVATRRTVLNKKMNRIVAELRLFEEETASFIAAQKQINEVAENLQILISDVAQLESLLSSKQKEFNEMESTVKKLDDVRYDLTTLPQTDPKFVELRQTLKCLKENSLELFCDGLNEEKQRLLSLKQEKMSCSRVCNAAKSDVGYDGDNNDDDDEQWIVPPLEENLPEERGPVRKPSTPIVSVHEFANRRKRTDKNRERDFVKASSLISSQRGRKRSLKIPTTPPGQRKMTSYLSIERVPTFINEAK